MSQWKAIGLGERSQSKGSEESLYPKQLGHSVKEKSLSMGTESLSVGEKTNTRLSGKQSESESRQTNGWKESFYPK